MRKCNEKPSGIYGHYCCGNGVTIDGVRYCSEYGIKIQIDYAGHLFCADLGEEADENQLSLFHEDSGQISSLVDNLPTGSKMQKREE